MSLWGYKFEDLSHNFITDTLSLTPLGQVFVILIGGIHLELIT
jgi:hypothetical protein